MKNKSNISSIFYQRLFTLSGFVKDLALYCMLPFETASRGLLVSTNAQIAETNGQGMSARRTWHRILDSQIGLARNWTGRSGCTAKRKLKVFCFATCFVTSAPSSSVLFFTGPTIHRRISNVFRRNLSISTTTDVSLLSSNHNPTFWSSYVAT